MADNFTAKDASGTTVTFGSDDVGGVQYARKKLAWGADGTAGDVSESNPLPVQTNSDVLTVTPTLDTSAYASGDVLFAATAVASVVPAAGGVATLGSLVLIDKDDQGQAIDLYFFDATVTVDALNAAWATLSDADAAKFLGKVSVGTSDWEDAGGARLAHLTLAKGVLLKPASGTSAYVVGICRSGTPTHTASGLVLRLGVYQD